MPEPRLQPKPRLLHPELERRADVFTDDVAARPDESERVHRLWDRQIRSIVELGEHPTACVIGCGPVPQVIRILAQKGVTVVGIEPVADYVRTAEEYLAGTATVKVGTAEEMALPDNSQDVVICESVIEHVDSMRKAVEEMHRVLAPGGVLYLSTVTRHRIHLTGYNGEFNTRFFNWFPQSVKDAYVHAHLHHDPTLANYSRRPAVHWPTFTELCAIGRDAGFPYFYSILDVMDEDDPLLSRSLLRRLLGRPWLLRAIKRRPWLRALALTQAGTQIFMVKRA